jgi:hypothetical protein
MSTTDNVTTPVPPSNVTNQTPITTKSYTYRKSYVTKSGEVRYCNQTVYARVTGNPPGRPKKKQ